MHVVFLFRVLQAVLGWKPSVLMDIHITITQRLEVDCFLFTATLPLVYFLCTFFFLVTETYQIISHCLFLISESSWEKPSDFPSTEAAGSGSSKEEESQEEPSTPQAEPLSGEEGSSSEAQASQEVEVPQQESELPKVLKISFRVRAQNNILITSAGSDSMTKK